MDDLLKRFGIDVPPGDTVAAVDALFHQADDLLKLGRAAEAGRIYDALVERYRQDGTLYVRSRVAHAMGLKGRLLAECGRRKEAISALDELLAWVGRATEPELREWASRALSFKAELLLSDGRVDEATVVSHALAARFERETDASTLAVSGKLLLGTGRLLFKEGQHEEAVRAFGAIVSRLDGAADPALRELVIHALSNTSNALGRMGRAAEARATHEEMVNRFGLDAVAAFEEQAKQRENRPEPEMREELATAVMKKALILIDLDRDVEARAAFTDLIRLFQDDEAPIIQRFVAAAYEARAALSED